MSRTSNDARQIGGWEDYMFKSVRLTLSLGTMLSGFTAGPGQAQAGLQTPAIGAASPTVGSVPATASSSAPPMPQAEQSATVGDIIVTAEKRSESINRIGLSINAASGDELLQRHITTTQDLVKIVPGLNFAPSQTQQPVYLLRGVGLYESGLASSPAVTVYVDQIPLATPVISEVPPLDLERVEVLKGPQGTLFGANSTGGAINYIAAKPTGDFKAGGDISYERFGRLDATGFVSGPITDTIHARLALRGVSGGAYQYSLSRPGDRLGNARTYQGRLIVDWRPTEALRFELSSTGFRDNDDTVAQQFVAALPPNPAIASANLLNQRPAPDDARAADWPSGYPLRSDDQLAQVSLRSDYDLTSRLTLTSLSSYQHFDENKLVDSAGFDGSSSINTRGPSNLQRALGTVSAFSQEVRIAQTEGRLRWTVGGNYQHESVDERQLLTINSTISQPLPFLPAFQYAAGETNQKISEYAVFANADYSITDRLTAHVGARYTESDRHGVSCTYDWNPTGDNAALANQITGLQQVFQSLGLKSTPVVPIAPSGCVSLTAPPDLSPTGVANRLNDNNLSFRAGLDYRTAGRTLIYGNVSRGYKAGVIGVFVASSTSEFTPAKQERLDAYEVGFKAPFADGRLHVNGAGFYYDYRNKQVRSHISDPIFGLLELLQNVPKSRVVGAELDLQAEPIRRLNLSVGGTYINSKVLGRFVSVNSANRQGDFAGATLPYTPKVQVTADGQYTWAVGGGLDAFGGASLTYHSRSNATFDSVAAPAPEFSLTSYGLLDLRAGLASADGRWRVTAFGRNVTNKFYPVTYFYAGDQRTRQAGPPATYGLSLSLRTQ